MLSSFMSQDIVKIWTVKFGKAPVICQIRQGFPLPKICAIWYNDIEYLHSGSTRLCVG